MTTVTAQVDPAEVGLDASRLTRIDRHFGRYVEDGRLPGYLAVVSRGGRVAHVACAGVRDLESGAPVETDTLWRIYSMTKPITSVAALMLWEEGALELTDPVARWLPEFTESRVWRGGTALRPVTEPLTEPVRVWHLLTHTAGLTYGFHHAHPVDTLYRQAGFEWGTPPGLDLAGCVATWASLPLLFQPGREWNYSVATDVLGRLVEVVSGQSLAEFVADRIATPLGLTDTGFNVPTASVDRLAALYVAGPPDGRPVRNDAMGSAVLREPAAYSGGGGLVSTAADYGRFAELLRCRGELDGVRLLGPRTVSLLSRNALPGGADLATFGRQLFAETPFDGVGFGLGVSVVLDPVAMRGAATAGEFGWGGAASTAFWVDPVEDLVVLFFTQLLPSSTHPIRPQLHQLVHAALVD